MSFDSSSSFSYRRFNFFLLMITLMLTVPCASIYASDGISIYDDTGEKIALSSPARRIVSLYGGLTETVCAMGLCKRLVGVTKRDEWPSECRDKTKVGTHMKPNLEIIMGLKPDLVLQGSVRPGSQMVVNRLKAMGIPVAIFNPVTFTGLYNEIKRIGILCNARTNARHLITELKGRLSHIEDNHPISCRPKVIFEISHHNSLFAGQKNFVSDVIKMAGGENPIAANKKMVKMNLEAVIALDPDIYIIQTGPMNRLTNPPETRPNFTAIRAVKEGRVLVVDEFMFSRPAPRAVNAVEQLNTYIQEHIDEICPDGKGIVHDER